MALFYVTGRSLLPVWVSASVYGLASSFVVFFKWGVLTNFFISLFIFVYFVLLWSKRVIGEGISGSHNAFMVDCFKFGFALFIFREVIFFFGVFWAFFDGVLSPPCEIGDGWPPLGVIPINPYGIPLFNTIILLSRGVRVTWAHHCLIRGKRASFGLVITVFLAFIFEVIQGVEYFQTSFSIRDGVFGRVFFLSTGFHGIHVFLGLVFLFFNTLRLLMGHFSGTHHLGLEFSILYWHFVDVVWIFLFVFVYYYSA